MKIKKLDEYYNIGHEELDERPEVLPEIEGRQGSPVIGMSISPDGNTIASVDGRIHIWDFSSGRKLRSFYSPSRLTSISFSKDGKYVISGNINGIIQVWNVSSGKIVRQFLRT